MGADGKPLPEEESPHPPSYDPHVEGSEGGDEVPEEVPDNEAPGSPDAPVRRPALPPGGQLGVTGGGRGRGKSPSPSPRPVFRPVLAPDLGKEYLITDLQSPPPKVFSLLGAKSKYEQEEISRNEVATTHAKQKTTFDGDDIDSDDNDWVEDDGGLQEEGIIPTSMCAQQ